MKIPIENLKSRSEFDTDEAYQHFYDKIFKRYKIDDGYSYIISLYDGEVHKKMKMKLESDKISKSDQKPKEE